MSSRTSTRMRIRSVPTSPRAGKGRTRILIQHTCYICGRPMSNAAPTLNHLYNMHGIDLPSREPNQRRPAEIGYEYVRDPLMDFDEIRSACPSCWYHCPEGNLDALCKHTEKEHDPVEIEESKRETMMGRRTRSRSNSVSSMRQRSRPPTTTPTEEEEVTETRQISKKLDELTDLFNSFFKDSSKST